MGLLDKKEDKLVTRLKAVESVIKKEELIEDKKKLWLTTMEGEESKRFCLVIGKTDESGLSDRTGKTGIVLNEISRKLEKDKEAKAYFFNIDNGLSNLARFYPKILSRIYAFNPLQTKVKNNLTSIDYVGSINEIRKIISFLKDNYKKENIKAIVFDGLSTYLNWCTDQMKEDKFITPDGTFSASYWQIRNKYFFETIYILKQLPIDIYLIGHDNFLKFDQEIVIKGKKIELGRLQKKLNDMMEQRIICTKHKDENENRLLKATIDKSRGNVLKEEKTFEIMTIKDNKVIFDSTKVFEDL